MLITSDCENITWCIYCWTGIQRHLLDTCSKNKQLSIISHWRCGESFLKNTVGKLVGPTANNKCVTDQKSSKEFDWNEGKVFRARVNLWEALHAPHVTGSGFEGPQRLCWWTLTTDSCLDLNRRPLSHCVCNRGQLVRVVQVKLWGPLEKAVFSVIVRALGNPGPRPTRIGVVRIGGGAMTRGVGLFVLNCKYQQSPTAFFEKWLTSPLMSSNYAHTRFWPVNKGGINNHSSGNPSVHSQVIQQCCDVQSVLHAASQGQGQG